MIRAEVPTLDTSDLPDLPYRLALDDLSPNRWEISREEDEKIEQAANRGKNAITMALAGDAEAMAELRRLGVTRWEHSREEAHAS